MKKLLLLLTISSLLLSCSSSKDDSFEESVANEGLIVNDKIVVSTNSEEPLILSVLREDETLVSYYGEKDSEGRTLNVNLISLLAENETDPILIDIDDLGRPMKIYSPDGASLEFNWISDNEIRITAIVADGSVVVNVPIFLDQLQSSKKINPKKVYSTRNGNLDVKINSLDELNYKSSLKQDNLNINVSRCGTPVINGLVGVKVVGDNGQSLFFQTDSKSNDGNYKFSIPEPKNDVLIKNICNSIESGLGKLCNVIDPITATGSTEAICIQISTAIDLAIAGPTGEGLVIFPTCELLIKSFNTYCSTLGKSATNGSQSILSSICKLAEPKYKLAKEYTFEPVIYVDGEGAFHHEKSANLSAYGPFPEINISLPENPRFANFYTIPLDPAPEQSYVAKANIYCAKAGTSAKISVTGTDGYEDEIIVSLPQGDSEISISVPGADEGVYDSLKVEAEGLGTLYVSVIF